MPSNATPTALSILGATGSIGTQTLDIVRLFPDRLSVKVLTGGRNVDLLRKQALEFEPELVVVGTEAGYHTLRNALADTSTAVAWGDDALVDAATWDGVDTIVAALVGFVGLQPVMAALAADRTIALANKETMVVAGALMRAELAKGRGTIVPVDSEHSAIFQCLVGEPPDSVEQLILTASGGPFRTRSAETFDQITKAEALNHPNWSMGAKITIDSATMMNKGLEVIEARWMFDVPADRIEVLVHPQSIIHSMVAFTDGSTKAQLGVPDMRVPIQYALSYPNRWGAPHPRIDWSSLACLDFEQPDLVRFPCLRLAFEALAEGGTAPAVLNAANEIAVQRFLEEDLRFVEIPRLIEAAVEALAQSVQPSLPDLVEADRATRRWAQEHRLRTVH
ncbi:MAG: 1-deoxy-D-xylulose-5-phosphate reductoisomerase [Rhodothermales bacterium]